MAGHEGDVVAVVVGPVAVLEDPLTVGDVLARADHPDGALYRQLRALDGPLLRRFWPQDTTSLRPSPSARKSTLGMDPALFGKHPDLVSRLYVDLRIFSTPNALQGLCER